MAIVIRGKTECPLCGSILSDADQIVMFPHFIADRAHPLWRFSDSTMHRSCFASWDQAEQFRSLHNRLWAEMVPNRPREMQPDGSIVDLD
jgi:hypothetical protein